MRQDKTLQPFIYFKLYVANIIIIYTLFTICKVNLRRKPMTQLEFIVLF